MDRVRLLLEDGTVLAEGVRPATECETLGNEALDSCGDSYDLRLIAPTLLLQEKLDLEEMMRRHGEWLHRLYYSGYNAAIQHWRAS